MYGCAECLFPNASSRCVRRTRDSQPFGWAQTYFPGETDPEVASRTEVQAGSEFWNMDIKLAAVSLAPDSFPAPHPHVQDYGPRRHRSL